MLYTAAKRLNLQDCINPDSYSKLYRPISEAEYAAATLLMSEDFTCLHQPLIISPRAYTVDWVLLLLTGLDDLVLRLSSWYITRVFQGLGLGQIESPLSS